MCVQPSLCLVHAGCHGYAFAVLRVSTRPAKPAWSSSPIVKGVAEVPRLLYVALTRSTLCACRSPAPDDQVSTLLNKTAIDLVKAGELEIFTPSYFFAARKK